MAKINNNSPLSGSPLQNDYIEILKESLSRQTGLKYLILAKSIEQLIKIGAFKRNQKMPPHRVLASQLGITAGTVSKSYGELARNNILIARVGGGTFVADNKVVKSDVPFQHFVERPAKLANLSVSQALHNINEGLIQQSISKLAQTPDIAILMQRYAPELGYSDHRKAGAKWMSHDNFEANHQQIICTNGGQHGLFITLLALLSPGQTIATERFTYPGLLAACQALHLKTVGLAMDKDGIIPQSLDSLCRQRKISALFCTPSLQNPTTVWMPLERRQQIAKICAENKILMIEDETHAILCNHREPPLGSFCTDQSIMIGSFNKATVNALRVGYLHVPKQHVNRIGAALRNTCWMISPLSLSLATNWILSGIAKDLVRAQVNELLRRKSLVAPYMKDLVWQSQTNAPHYWIELPGSVRAMNIAEQLKQRGCVVVPADSFTVDRNTSAPFIRASVSMSVNDDELLISGFNTLRETLLDPAHNPLIC